MEGKVIFRRLLQLLRAGTDTFTRMRGTTFLDRRGALTLFGGFLLLYLATLCPTVYFGDSGEISSAIGRGGIIHPPGYPLFSLLGRLALWGVPFGEPAFRVGTVVALAAAAAVAVLYLCGRALRLAPLAAASAAALFGVSFGFWSQSVRVEVYSLHVLLCATALLYTLRYRETSAPRDLFFACLAIGLGLAHHVTIVLLLPGLLLLAGKPLWAGKGLGKRLSVGIACLLAGLPLYGFLPLWARDTTLHNFSDPSSPQRFWNHVSARLYRGYLSVPTDWGTALTRAATVLREGLPIGIWVLILIGGVVLFRRDREQAIGLLVCAGTVASYNLCYKIADIAAYYLPVLAIAALFLAVAFDAGLTWLAVRPLLPRLALVAAPLALLLHNLPTCNLHNATLVREFARHKLESCDPNAVLLLSGDQDINPVDYAQEMLEVRPDVLTIGRDFVRGMFAYDWETTQWYLRRLRALGVDAPLGQPTTPEERSRLAHDGYLIQLLEGPLAQRPFHQTFLAQAPNDPFYSWLVSRYVPVPQGLVLHWWPSEPKPQPRQLAARSQQVWERLTLPDLSQVDTSQEMDPGYLRQHYLTMLSNYGGLWELAGEPERALAIYQLMRDWAPDQAPAILKTMGSLAARALPQTRE